MVNNCQTGYAKARHAKPCFFCFQNIFSKSVSHFSFHIIDRVPVSHFSAFAFEACEKRKRRMIK